MPLPQAIPQPFVQESVHTPFFRERIMVVQAVVLGMMQSAPATAGNYFGHLGIVVDAHLDVGRREYTFLFMEMVGETQRGGEPAAFEELKVKIKHARDTRDGDCRHAIQFRHKVSQPDVVRLVQLHEVGKRVRPDAVIRFLSQTAFHRWIIA
jgi:hypothetical protein